MIKKQKSNKEVVKLWFEEGWNKDKTKELVPTCFAPDWEQSDSFLPDQITGHEGMYQLLERFGSAFTEIRFDLTHLFAEDKLVCVRYSLVAVHTGAFLGVEATNKKITTTGIAIYEMENNKIKVTWGEIDFLGLLTQIK